MRTTQDDIWVPSSVRLPKQIQQTISNVKSDKRRMAQIQIFLCVVARNIYNNSYSSRLCDSLGKSKSSSNSSADRGIVLCFCT